MRRGLERVPAQHGKSPQLDPPHTALRQSQLPSNRAQRLRRPADSKPESHNLALARR